MYKISLRRRQIFFKSTHEITQNDLKLSKISKYKKSEKEIIQEYNLNIISPTLLSRKYINTYADNKKLLINIGSGAANKAIASWSAYCATKSGLDMFTEVIAEEKHKNLTIFSIHPGVVDTNMQKKIRESDAEFFPIRQQFIDYYSKNELFSADFVAQKIYQIIAKRVILTDVLVDLRDFS